MSLLRSFVVSAVLAAIPSWPALASDLVGTTADPSGAPIEAARLTLLNLATGAEVVVQSDADGRFRIEGLSVGIYRLVVVRDGFSEDSRTVSIADPVERLEVAFVLRPGGLTASVTVTATRSERDTLEVPLKTDTITREQVLRTSPVSTGDVLVQAPGITPVGSGPYATRPRLRGLDSTRLLVLVDGDRLNNARTATDRSGAEVGLVDLATVEDIEVVSGAGSVLYGTDALSGTINIITNQPSFSDGLRFTYGFDGYYSSNESGRRGAATFGASHRRFSAQVVAGVEQFDDYRAGGDATEDTRPLHADGTLTQADTIDDNFGFTFNAFPDPFNAPFVRTDHRVPTSGAEGHSLNASALFALTGMQTLRVKYQRRHMEDVGFPDFEPPYFFQRVSLPYSDFDRVAARYEARALTPWFSNLKVSAYYQDQRRLLRNEFPVQFPVPSPAFFPINVYQLQITADTEQRVRTPGVDVQGTFLASSTHVVTAGTTVYSDRSRDTRRNVTQNTLVGNVALGPRGPQANVLAAPQLIGSPTTTTPARVPDASFSDIGLFVQDEWAVSPNVKVVAGLRYDNYRVATKDTPGYDGGALAEGAQPPIDPASLPDPAGDSLSRNALTGDLGVVYRLNDQLSVLAHYGRSYRHPNLEELLYSGAATIGAIVPNLNVGPETGHNVEVGVKARTPRYAGALSYFHNTYDGFISTEIVARTSTGPISQAINFADVRIQGVEGDAQAPLTLGRALVTLFGNFAYTHGTVLGGTNPLSGASLAGTPQDNISPFKSVIGVRVADRRDRLWIEYGNRFQADVDRVATTLIESPYLIAQDLFSLDGFTIHRLAWGVNFTPRGRGDRLGLTCALENLTDQFYREQFQFAPARGRSVTVALHVRGH